MATETKPGVKTTEFWLNLAVSVGTLVAGLSSALPPKWATIAITVSNGLYYLSRGEAKKGVPYTK